MNIQARVSTIWSRPSIEACQRFWSSRLHPCPLLSLQWSRIITTAHAAPGIRLSLRSWRLHFQSLYGNIFGLQHFRGMCRNYYPTNADGPKTCVHMLVTQRADEIMVPDLGFQVCNFEDDSSRDGHGGSHRGGPNSDGRHPK